MAETPDNLAEIVRKLHENRWLALQYLFKHRHKKASAPFHPALVDAWFSPAPRGLNVLFRGAAKSTYSEEGMALSALHREFKYGLIIGETYQKAVERLASIAYELETNKLIRKIYGHQIGRVWRENVIQLTNGTILQVFGRGQNVRGEKNPYSNDRPDFIMVDDVEDKDSVRSPESRKATLDWFNHEVLPAMEDDDCRVRVNGTLLHPECLISVLKHDPEWMGNLQEIPAWAATEGLDTDPDNPHLVSNWPDKMPVPTCRRIIKRFTRSHDLNGLCQEYLCRSMEESTKYFPREHVASNLALLQDVPSFAPRYVIVDPARKGNVIRKGNARTGYLAVAVLGSQWWALEAFGRYHTPEQVVAETFRLHDTHRPIWNCLEADGLEEFLWAPFRAEMMRRNVTLPIKPLYAPKNENKDAFILGVQPFYKSSQIKFLGYKNEDGTMNLSAVQDLIDEMDAFPSGLKDVLNCLAYVPQARGGEPIYADFGPRHVLPGADAVPPSLCHHLLFHGDPTMGVAVLASYGREGQLTVLEDYLFAPTSEELNPILTVCRTRPKLKVWATPSLFRATGGPIVGMLRRQNLPPSPAKPPETGSLTGLLRLLIHNEPALQVSPDAQWSVKALSGGYCRNIASSGQVFDEPSEGAYRVVGEALEALGALTQAGVSEGDDSELLSYTRSGSPYLSVLRR